MVAVPNSSPSTTTSNAVRDEAVTKTLMTKESLSSNVRNWDLTLILLIFFDELRLGNE